jgi:succinoglycan biosynthesis transport protein ExoP
MLQPIFDYDPSKTPVESGFVSSRSAASSRTVDLREMVRILRRRRWIVIGVVGVLVGAAAVFVAVSTPRYTATSTVLIDPHRSHVADTSDQAPPPSNFGSDDAMIESQVLLIQSVAVLGRVVDKLNLTKDSEFGPHPGLLDPIKHFFAMFKSAPAGHQSADEIARALTIEALSQKLKVTREGTTFVIDVDVSSESPEKAAALSNAISDAYFDEQVQSKYNTNKIAASWLNRQIDDLRAHVQASDREVEEFRAANNLITTQGQTVNDQQLTDLNNKLIDAHVQTAEAKARFDQVQNISKTHADPGTLDQALASDVIKQLRKQYADVAKTLADAQSKYGPQHPMVVNARAQLKETQRLIDQEVQRILDNTREAYRVAQSREQALRASLDQLQSASTSMSKAQVRLRELQREADANRTLYESFLARYKQTTAQESLELPDSRIVSRADVPISPSFPKTTIILALAVLVGCGLGALVAFVVDFLDRRVKSLRQAEEVTNLPTLAAIPLVGTRELAHRANRGREALSEYDPKTPAMLPPVMQPPLMRYALDEPTSLFAEAVRAVRLAIQRSSRSDPVRTVMVSSSIDGEGKSTLSVNLALSLAAVGMRTVLVDGDLRNPELTRSLAPQAKHGLVEVAAGHVPLQQALLHDRPTGLAFLPTPPRRKGGFINEFVFSESMSNLLDHLRNQFDFVVIDSPPLVPLVDARAIGELADRIVLAIRWDATPQEVVGQALESLGPAYERVLGTVLTRVDLSQLRFYDYYRSSHYIQPYSYLGQPRAEAVP